MKKNYQNFKPRECLRVIQNLFASPKYTELKIGMRAYIKLMCYCHLAGDQEITGIGRIKDGEIIDFKIPYQIVTGTTANATDEDIINLMREIPIDEIPEWELDWHSHCDMQTFISATDEDNYELMSMAKGGKQFPILVVNKKGDVCCKQFIHAGKVPTIAFKLIKDALSSVEIEEIYNKCKCEVAERVEVEEIKTVYAQTSYNYKPTYNQGKFVYSSFNNNKYHSKKNSTELKNNEDDYKYICSSCGVELQSVEEINNGLCDDCMDAWINSEY